MDFVFLFAVGCADIGANEAAEDGKAYKDDGSDGLRAWHGCV